MNKPFFFRIDVADLLNFATDPDGESMTVLQLAKELQHGESEIEYIQQVIDEAKEFKEKKRNAGKLGGLAKSSSAKAVLKQNLAKPSTPLARSSTVTEELKPIVEQTSLDCISSVIDHLNKKTGKKYRAGSKSSRMHILARTKEGHTLDDFIAAIDNQAGAWMGTEWEKYLRPSTLFNSEKFEGYVNNTGKKAKVKRTREDLIREYGSA